ncbi:MAG TPA: molybdate ABC transporter substrate-binding protein [Gemmatimonadales bacterium]|nr:molybdate ABC transporter substrate-binding protein [Gemmatimonadales bacterium]
MKRVVSLLLLVLASTARLPGQVSSPPRGITVYAAASLTEALLELGELSARGNTPTRVRYNFAGSQQLAVQLEQGARADVFASADQRWMDYLGKRDLVAGTPRIFAHNRLVAIVPRANPARIHVLQDLARPGVKLVVGAEAVPVGTYTREMLRRLARQAGFPPSYGNSVLGNVVSQEENVKGVVAKVQLGEADAGIVYRTDVTPGVAPSLTVLEIPDDANVVASYPVAVLRASADSAAAKAFVALLLSPEGRRVLARHGLTPAETTP